MKLKVKSVHFDADQKLLTFIQEKVDKLEHFYEDILTGEVSLRVENSQDAENKYVQIRLNVPGNDLVAKEQCKTFEEATDLAVEALKKQILKHKDKIRS
jgi:putative sigma-54 modulation protein